MNYTPFTGNELSAATREFYFNIGDERAVIYLFLVASLSFLAFSLYRRIQLWKKGKEALRTDRPLRRIMAVIKYVLLQKKVVNLKSNGLTHGLIFFGFISLVAVTAILTIQEDITWPIFGTRFLEGLPYLSWSFFADIMGLVLLTGVIAAIIRRYIVKPDCLDTRGTDTFALFSLLAVIITGFTAEGLRIAITEFPDFEVWSPAGYVIGKIFSGLDINTLTAIHYANWWIHMAGSFVFIALLGTGKLGHVIISTLNIYFMNLDNETHEKKYALDVINPEEFEKAEEFGVSHVKNFTWKQLMDGDACTRCGRCQDNCPAYLTGKPLSPKKLIQDIKANMETNLLPQAGSSEIDAGGAVLLDGAVAGDEFWACTNCGACLENCPVAVEHVQKIIDMRRYKVLMEGDMATELQTAFQNLETNYNPYGFAFAERGAWIRGATARGLEVPLMSENPEVDYLYFVGSAASYDRRNQKVALAFLKIMKAAGIRIGILGPEEADSGDAAMRGGNEYLFHALAARNMETFRKYNVRKIICTCPHDYNMLKKEYRRLKEIQDASSLKTAGYDYQVFHHTEIIAGLIRNRLITPKKPLPETVVYHDSCFLGRYNGLYDEPRYILKSIPGIQLIEMDRSRNTSFCCGAGGARMFIEEHLGTRINQFRTREAQKTGASRIATACPFCMTMLSDGIAELDIETMTAMDVAEIMFLSMEER